MLDFEGPENGPHGVLSRLLHSNQRLKDNSESRVLHFMAEAAFAEPKKGATGRCFSDTLPITGQSAKQQDSGQKLDSR
jgi:hypothetical protein